MSTASERAQLERRLEVLSDGNEMLNELSAILPVQVRADSDAPTPVFTCPMSLGTITNSVFSGVSLTPECHSLSFYSSLFFFQKLN